MATVGQARSARQSRGPHWLLMGLLGLVGGVALAAAFLPFGSAPPPPPEPAQAEPEVELDLVEVDEEVAALADDPAVQSQLEVRAESAERELSSCLEALQDRGDDSGQLRARLVAADERIAELEYQLRRQKIEDQVRGASRAAAETLERAAQRGRAQRPTSGLRIWGGAQLTIVGNRPQATGRVWNYADIDTHAELVIELLEDGKTVRQQTQRITVPAQSVLPFSQNFRYSVRNGSNYAARAYTR